MREIWYPMLSQRPFGPGLNSVFRCHSSEHRILRHASHGRPGVTVVPAMRHDHNGVTVFPPVTHIRRLDSKLRPRSRT